MDSVKRGRILRDTAVRDGLVFVDGQQYLFRLEGMWKSEFAPKVNMLVDVEFDERGRLSTLRAAPVEDIAAEHTAQALNVTKATTRKLAQEVRSSIGPVVAQYAQAIGYPTLLALAALLLGWFYFSAASLNIGITGRVGVTFYQALRFLNARALPGMAPGAQVGGAGIYGLVCFLCCGGVVLPWLWRDRRASYGMLAPSLFMVLVGILVRHRISLQMSGFEQTLSQFGSFGGAHAHELAAQFADQVATRIRSSISIDFGTWLSVAASLYLAWRGTRLASARPQPGGEHGPGSHRRPVAGGAPAQRASATKPHVPNGSRRQASPSP